MIPLQEIILGMKVYHSVFPHWGEGFVRDLRQRDNLGDRTRRKIRVQWSGEAPHDGYLWMERRELRRTPKRVRETA